jgi:hypothetical protein
VAVLPTPNQQIMPAAGKEDVDQVLSRVLSSKYFANAPKKQKFLRLICDFYLNGRAGELNEYLIGREVFDRDEGYNPASDPIVRVGAHDVRKKLDLYYKGHGANDAIRLGIPIGSYEPIFIRTHKDPAPPEHPKSPDQSPSLQRSSSEESSIEPEATGVTGATGAMGATGRVPFRWKGLGWGGGWMGAANSSPENIISSLNSRLRLLYLLLAVLLIGIGILAYPHLLPRQQVSGAISPSAYANLGPVWEPFLKGDDSILLVLSNPLVYRLLNAGDTEISIKNSVELPPDKASNLNEVMRDHFAVLHSPPNPRLVLSIDTYTGLGEAIGVTHVTDLLRTAGRTVSVKRSRTVSAEDMKEHHVVLFGSVWANEWSGKLPLVEVFQVTGQATITNLNPQPGEEREYRSKFDESTGMLVEDYALVTVKPNLSNPNLVMILAGLRSAGTEAAAEYVTSNNHLSDLNRRLLKMGRNNGPPRSFQALLKVGVENGIPTRISLIALRELGTQNDK